MSLACEDGTWTAPGWATGFPARRGDQTETMFLSHVDQGEELSGVLVGAMEA
ncbi:MAG TPA: hypothetical protein VMR02_17630 [Terracidiphilus sp.]|jgi:hypothetical protein|nr:hypothetical protein [Terracidiphilus sp.]